MPTISERLASLEVKVDTMWQFQLRRGMAEGVQAGLGTLSSPFKVNDAAKAAFSLMADELQAFYQELFQQNGGPMPVEDLTLHIERAFGMRILKDVCLPYNLRDSSCLLIAAAVARGEDEISLTESDLYANEKG